MLLVCVAVCILLVLVASVNPRLETMSGFELHRRDKNGDKAAQAALRRQAFLVDIFSLQKFFAALLLVTITLLLVALLGWGLGSLFSLLVVVGYGSAARIPFVQKRAQKMYESYESALLEFIEKHPRALKLTRTVTPEWKKPLRLDSREELGQLISSANGLLSSEEQKYILHGLAFSEKHVKDIMTPRSSICSIPKNELLGPLVLDDLHKTGHSRFPVTDGDIDHIVGVLYIQDLLTVDSGKRSTTVEKTMSPRVFYIREDQPLSHALAAFLRTHHHLFIVINELRETVGLLSLEDVIEALIGRKIIDEFDTHEDIRAVAARTLVKTITPKNERMSKKQGR